MTYVLPIRSDLAEWARFIYRPRCGRIDSHIKCPGWLMTWDTADKLGVYRWARLTVGTERGPNLDAGHTISA